ncbi:MAG: hypothetical protein CM1200mP39_11360 [Dehalococcoidia bacterium]|nr:MAG: hypothetical protein CM1200mP39_11360 [Dehalococcoidia bacterium]
MLTQNPVNHNPLLKFFLKFPVPKSSFFRSEVKSTSIGISCVNKTFFITQYKFYVLYVILIQSVNFIADFVN